MQNDHSVQVMPGHIGETVGGVLESYPIPPGVDGIVVIKYDPTTKRARMAHVADDLGLVQRLVNAYNGQLQTYIFAKTLRNGFPEESKTRLETIERIVDGETWSIDGHSMVEFNAATGKINLY